jgi:hypothetical protein
MRSSRRWRVRFEQALQSAWMPAVLIVAVLAAALIVQRNAMKRQAREVERPRAMPVRHSTAPRRSSMADSLGRAVGSALSAQELGWTAAPVRRPPARWTVQVPSRLPVPSVHHQVQEAVRAAGGEVLSAAEDPASGRVELRIGAGDSCLLVLVLRRAAPEAPASRCVAVVIDDFGDRRDAMVEAFMALDFPITFSVLPGRRHSARIAAQARERGHEVLLHLIMEPLNEPFKDDGLIVLKGMPPAAVREVVDRSLGDVPGALGVNNHMGSKATQDRATLIPVFERLLERGLFFLDSYTIASSVAHPLAREMGLRSARRDVFLDVGQGVDSIRGKLRELANRAGAGGSVGIGHCHRDMLAALQAEQPVLAGRGVRFVFVSELVR